MKQKNDINQGLSWRWGIFGFIFGIFGLLVTLLLDIHSMDETERTSSAFLGWVFNFAISVIGPILFM